MLGDATAAVVWFSSPFFPVYIVHSSAAPLDQCVKSFIDSVYVLDEDSRRGLSNQIFAAQEKVASLSNVLQWPALAFLGREINAAAGRLSSLNYRWLRGAKKWVTPDRDSEPRALGGLTVPTLPVISSRPRVLGDATAAVVWFSSPST